MAEIVHLPLPPHSVEAEQAVLGTLLLEGPTAWPLVSAILKPQDFYRPDHRAVFAAVAEFAGNADPVTLYAHLERQGRGEEAGGLAYLSRLARETLSTANVEAYARVVRERSELRALAAIGARLEASAVQHGTSAESVRADLERDLSQLRDRAEGGLVPASELAGALLDDLDRRKEGATGLMTGLADFDELTGGLEPGELTVFAGRPGLGKTALMVTIAAHVSRDRPVAVFSAEMPALALARRCAALLGGVSQTALRRPQRMADEDWQKVTEGACRLGERKLAIDDRHLPSLEHIRAQSIRHKARGGLALVLIDYCQLVEGRGANRYEQLRDVAYGTKALAKEVGVPVVMLAQLNREVERREHKRPYISDLRDSGAVEEAADTVGLLYGEGYYDSSFPMPHVIECALEKHRNGERGQCLWHFAGEFSRMTALDLDARKKYRQLVTPRKGKQSEEREQWWQK